MSVLLSLTEAACAAHQDVNSELNERNDADAHEEAGLAPNLCHEAPKCYGSDLFQFFVLQMTVGGVEAKLVAVIREVAR